MPAFANSLAGPGIMGVPVKPWIKGIAGDEVVGTAPGIGLQQDKIRNAPVWSTSNGVSMAGGARGQAASPQQLPSTLMNLYVRKTGSDNNGGSSNGTAPDRTGTDGVTAGTTTFTAASGAFTADDVNKLINIVTKGRYRIVGFTNSTTVTLSGSPSAGSGLTWNLGGAVATIGALLLNANAAVLGGDRIWIGAGTYREQISPLAINPSYEVRVEGDVTGVMTGDAGLVMLTTYLSGDKSAPVSGGMFWNNGRSYLTFKRMFFFMGGGSNGRMFDCRNGHDFQFIECVFAKIEGHNTGGNLTIDITGPATPAGPHNLLVDRCIFYGGANSGIQLGSASVIGGSDFELNAVIRDSIFHGQPVTVAISSSGSGSGKPGGALIQGCTHSKASNFVAPGAGVSTSIPTRVSGCFINSMGVAALNANTFGQIVEDYNLIVSVTPRTNVAVGPHSISDGSYAPMFQFGQELLFGFVSRPIGEPMVGSPLLGFGGDLLASDLFDRPRPAGYGTAGSQLPAVGALERGNSWGKETTTVRTGTTALSITGPGYQDFEVPVDAVATTFSIYGRYDSTYTGPRPQFFVLNGAECGVGDQTSPPVVNANAWEQLSVTFTPTSKGIVTLRVVSFDVNGGGKAFFDDFAIA